jgi:hypothetical protein
MAADCTALFSVMNVPRSAGSAAEVRIAMPGIMRPLMHTKKQRATPEGWPRTANGCTSVVAIMGTTASTASTPEGDHLAQAVGQSAKQAGREQRPARRRQVDQRDLVRQQHAGIGLHDKW